MKMKIAKRNSSKTILSQITTDNVIDADLSIYDDLFIIRSTSSEFKVTLPYNHLIANPNVSNPNNFMDWWAKYTNQGDAENIYVYVYSSSNQLLAEGDLYEYEEDRKDFELTLTCVPELITELDNAIEIKNFEKTTDMLATTNVNTWKVKVYQHFNELYRKAILQSRYDLSCEAFPYESNPTGDLYTYFNNLMFFRFHNFIFGILDTLATANYYYKMKTKTEGMTKREFIRELAKLFQVKFIYNQDQKKFLLKRDDEFTSYNLVDGYVKSKCKKQLLDIENNDFFSEFSIKNVKNQKVGDVNPLVKNMVQQRLNTMQNPIEYHIWGYANRYIVTGEAIVLKSVTYLVKEISYEIETVNNLKSFNAVCYKI